MSDQAGIERNLDILRSFAVLLVFASHLEIAIHNGQLNYDNPFVWRINAFTLGRTGVLLFFVHTSLVLMLSMGRMVNTGWGLVWRFYIRRLFRLYPLSIVCIVLISVFSIPKNLFGDPFVWNWRVFVSNLLLIQNLTGDTSLENPLWSLPYEVQMYLALPFVFLILRTRRVGVLAALMFAAVLLGWRVPLLEFAPCFMAGVCAFVLLRHRKVVFPWWIWPAFLVCALSAFCLFDPSRITARKSWTFCTMVGLAVPFFQECLSPAIVRVPKMIARYSYGIYLCHQPLMWIFFRKVTWPAEVRYPLFALSVTVVPVLAYHLLEKPLIGAGVGLTRKGQKKLIAAVGRVQPSSDPIMAK
jgi:peptidoglycan/LPS O-acetylase OafA/YrhL